MKKVSSKKLLKNSISSKNNLRSTRNDNHNKGGSARRISKRGGFTLTEMIIVVVVVAIIASVALPSMVGFIRHGQQVNRMNIARTIYLSMQNQLSRAMVEGNLGSVLTNDFLINGELGTNLTPDGFVLNTENRVGLVAPRLGDNFPDDENEGNENRVYFISKPANYVPFQTTGTPAVPVSPILDSFYRLLDEVIIDKEILDGAILMEANIETGVVMSIFYGDEASMRFSLSVANQNNREFVYGGDVNRNNVNGPRGMAFYDPFAREQGYYGIRQTNTVQLPHIDIVNIYDGFNTPLMDPDEGFIDGEGNDVGIENILYAEFLLAVDESLENAENNLIRTRELFIVRSDSGNGNLFEANLVGGDIANDFRQALNDSQTAMNHDAIFYDNDGNVTLNVHGVSVDFFRYIWILDFIEGEILNAVDDGQQYNIHGKNVIVGESEPAAGLTAPANIRARSVKDDAVITSATIANTHFAAEWPNGSFAITTPRHLNNIRHLPSYSYVQNAHINMDTLAISGDTHNFTPIPNFTGTYTATYGANMQWRIENLIINTTGLAAYNNANVGLFATVNSSATNPNPNGIITGVSLIYANVIAPNARYVGSIVGELAGGTVNRCNALADVVGFGGDITDGTAVGTTGTATGGLIGAITGSTLTNSFNAGFFHTQNNVATTSEGNYGSVTAGGGNIGGLVGENRGTVQRSFNNARVNISAVDTLTPPRNLSINPVSIPVAAGSNIGGLVGLNTGTSARVLRSYATNYVAAVTDTANATYSGSLVGRNGIGATIQYGRTLTISTPIIGYTDATAGPVTNTMSVTKVELMTDDVLGGTNGFVFASVEDRAFYLDDSNFPHDSVYDIYPYPVLPDNAFNTYEFWGWEDIDVSDISQTTLVYFERYNNATGPYGFGSGAVSNTLDDSTTISVNRAGYMLLVVVEDTEIDPTTNIGVYVRPVGSTGDWTPVSTTFNPTTGQNMPSPYNHNFFFSELNLNTLESALNEELARNTLLEYVVAYGVDPATNNPNNSGDEVQRGFLHPLFANSVTSTSSTNSFMVRTPWQMQNIDKMTTLGEVGDDYTGPAGDWSGFLHLRDSNGNQVVPGDPNGGLGLQHRPATQDDQDNLLAFLRAARLIAESPFGTVLPPTSAGTVFTGTTLTSTTSLPAGVATTNYIVRHGSLSIGPLTAAASEDIEYLYVDGNLTFTGNVNMPNLKGIYVTGNVIINRGAVVSGLTARVNSGVTLVGTSVAIGRVVNGNLVAGTGNLTVNAGTATGNATVSNMRFFALGNITISEPGNSGNPRPFLYGNSIYMAVGASSNIIFAEVNNSRIGQADSWSQFYSMGNITMTNNGTPHIYGVFAAMGLMNRGTSNTTNIHGVYLGTPFIGGTGLRSPLNNIVNMLDPGILPDPPDYVPIPNPAAGNFIYTQTRNINFVTDVSLETNDGTTPDMTDKFAVVQRMFIGTYNGYGGASDTLSPRINTIYNVIIETDIISPHGLFSVIGDIEEGGYAGIVENVILNSASIRSLVELEEGVPLVPVGGITGINARGIIRNCTVINTNGIYGFSNVGGIAGINDAIVRESTVISSTIRGTGINTVETIGVGGIAGLNNGDIVLSLLDRTNVISGGMFTGGIAGINSKDVLQSGVQYSTVTGVNIANATDICVGGIVGGNASDATVVDVFFLSLRGVNSPPVDIGTISTMSPFAIDRVGINTGGGIVGFNDNASGVLRAFYLAPAPFIDVAEDRRVVGTEIELTGAFRDLYPIVRAGYPAFLNTTNDEDDSIRRQGAVETSFFLAGNRYSLNMGVDGWTNARYNLETRAFERDIIIPYVMVEGGGQRLNTKFFDFEWLSLMYRADLDNWFQPPPTVGYPYPVLNTFSIPTAWPVADSPARPDQLDRDNWADVLQLNERARPPDFPNGDFTEPFLAPLIMNLNVPASNWITRSWFSVDMDAVVGWMTRPTPIDGVYSLFNTANSSYLFPTGTGEEFRTTTSNLVGPATAATDAGGTPSTSTTDPGAFIDNPLGTTSNLPDLFNTRAPGAGINPLPWPGWGTLPLYSFPANPSVIPRWRLIEFQDPNGQAHWMPSNYLGFGRNRADSNPYRDTNPVGRPANVGWAVNRYVELNAQSQGTLYQVRPTTPGATFMYSFYQASRLPGYNTNPTRTFTADTLSFYLTPVDIGEDSIEVTTAEQAAERDNAMILIRPATAPRSTPAGLTTGAFPGSIVTGSRINLAAWNTIAYGASNQNTPYTFPNGYDIRTFHNGKSYLQPSGERAVQNIPANTVLYLYDVWVDTSNPTTIFTSTIGPPASPTANATFNNINVTANPNVVSSTNPSAVGGNGGGTRTGYGITFWSTTPLTVNGTTTATQAQSGTSTAGAIALNGITQAQLSAGTQPWMAQALTQTIGYWSVSYGWKHYYGEYESDSNAVQTEFAFQSHSTNAEEGNFLDGVSFLAPSFLAVDLFIRDKNTNAEVNFVSMGQQLTADVNIRGFGDIPADNISVDFNLSPFDKYIAVDTGSNITYTKTNANNAIVGIGTITHYTGTGSIPAGHYRYTEYPNGSLTVNLPANVTLTEGESVLVQFGVDVLYNLMPLGEDTADTLLYFFRTQAVVNYNQVSQMNTLNDNFAFSRVTLSNASDVVQTFIDPIQLSKTVTPPINGPFTVTLGIQVADDINAEDVFAYGIINDVIPAGFRLRQWNGQAGVYVVDANGNAVPNVSTQVLADGTTRITIRAVNIGDDVESLEYRYQIVYEGSEFGVITVGLNAEYRFEFIGEDIELDVMLAFPQPVIGISIWVHNDQFAISAASDDQSGEIRTSSLTITRNSNRESGDDGDANMRSDQNYAGDPVVTMTNGTWIELGGNMVQETADYVAVLRTGTWELEITPKADRTSQVFEFTYRIEHNPSRPGATPPSFALSSNEATVTVYVVDADDMLVYYEEYSDGTFGFYYDDPTNPINTLNNNPAIDIETWGYGVLSIEDEGMLIQIGTELSTTNTPQDPWFLYTVESMPTLTTWNGLLGVAFGEVGTTPTPIGEINPNFAMALFPVGATGAGTDFIIRTTEQLDYLESLLSSGGALDSTSAGDFVYDDTGLPNFITVTGDVSGASVTYTFTFERGIGLPTDYAPTSMYLPSIFTTGIDTCKCCTCDKSCDCSDEPELNCLHICSVNICNISCNHNCEEDCEYDCSHECNCSDCDYDCECDDELNCEHDCKIDNCEIQCTCNHDCIIDNCAFACDYVCDELYFECLHDCDDECYDDVCTCEQICNCECVCSDTSLSMSFMFSMPLVGYGITHTNTFKSFMRKANARAIRRINQERK
ncbi:MAG: prepilin-type N-terminal cleavage/methylation domain-containing protein [Oscillospiraceae bacterium]|nr:prepilin-type N-terminal cleavage/methylation domain-containing protein [Oscillospiraceae bacterium]